MPIFLVIVIVIVNYPTLQVCIMICSFHQIVYYVVQRLVSGYVGLKSKDVAEIPFVIKGPTSNTPAKQFSSTFAAF